MGRGTTKADPAAVEALALENVAAAEAASAATKPPTVDVPTNGIIPTGGLTEGQRVVGRQMRESC